MPGKIVMELLGLVGPALLFLFRETVAHTLQEAAKESFTQPHLSKGKPLGFSPPLTPAWSPLLLLID